ncbi:MULTISPECIES: hypothetical protein [unclassified Streptomyces]|uniref:hypothetical protein n=1 Tax=unclassified Streptomyces TaxID=2593676 RepID=UPI0020A6A31B|nr:hypothetical protein [Streptomyces sp. CNQ-509]
MFALAAVETFLARTGGPALVVGADTYSRPLNPRDRRTVVLFGACAGAPVVGTRRRDGAGLRNLASHTSGKLADLNSVPAGCGRLPVTRRTHEAEFGLPDALPAPHPHRVRQHRNRLDARHPPRHRRRSGHTGANSSSSPVSAAACRWGSPSWNGDERAPLSHLFTPPPCVFTAGEQTPVRARITVHR